MKKKANVVLIGERLKEERLKLGIQRIEDLAEKIDSSYTAINRIEAGRSSYKLLNDYLFFLCENGVDLNKIYKINQE